MLGLAELLWCSGCLVIAFALGHIGATLLVAAWLTAAVELARLPPAVSRATDVGMSYGAVPVLGALTAAIPRRWRPIWVGWWLAVAVAVIAIGDDFTDTGHGVALSGRRSARPWCFVDTRDCAQATKLRVAMYLSAISQNRGRCLANGQRNSSADASIQSDRHDSGGSSSSSPGISHS